MEKERLEPSDLSNGDELLYRYITEDFGFITLSTGVMNILNRDKYDLYNAIKHMQSFMELVWSPASFHSLKLTFKGEITEPRPVDYQNDIESVTLYRTASNKVYLNDYIIYNPSADTLIVHCNKREDDNCIRLKLNGFSSKLVARHSSRYKL